MTFNAVCNALERAAETRDSSYTELDQALLAMAQLRTDIVNVPKYRPWVRFWEFADDVMVRLSEVVECCLDAMGEDTPASAERVGSNLQVLLDRVSQPLSKIRFQAELAVLFEGHAPSRDGEDILALLTTSKSLDHGARVDPSGLSIGTLVDEIPEELKDPVLNEGLKMTALQVALGLSPSRFWKQTLVAFDSLMSSPKSPRDVFAQTPPMSDDVRRATRDLYQLLMEIRTILQQHKTEQYAVRNALNMGAHLLEDIAKPLMAAFLTITRKHDYSRLLRSQPSVLVTQMEQAGFADMLLGFDLAVRHAHSHREYRYDEESPEIRLFQSATLKKVVSMSELVDIVLAANESVLIIHTALMCALVKSGYSVKELDPVGYLGIDVDIRIRIGVAAFGWIATKLECASGRVRIQAKSLTAVRPFHFVQVAAGLTAYLPDSYAFLTMDVSHEGHTYSGSGPLSPIREWQEQTGPMADVSFVKMLQAWLTDDSPVVSRPQVRTWAINRFVEAMRGGGTEGMSELCNAFAGLGDDDLLSAMRRVCVGYGLTQVHIRPPQDFFDALNLLEKWLKEGVNSPLDLVH